MILLIKHTADWKLIRQKNQTKINKDTTHKNCIGVDYDYQVGDKVVLTNNSALKYETPYNGQLELTWCWTNGTVTLQYGAIKIGHNILQIKPYTSDTNFQDNKC